MKYFFILVLFSLSIIITSFSNVKKFEDTPFEDDSTYYHMLEYSELEDLDSKIFLQNGYLNIEAPKVSFRGAPLSGTQVELPTDLSSNETWLKVMTHTRPSKDDIHYWLNDSPIKEHTAVISESLDIKGVFVLLII